MSQILLNVADIHHRSKANGPGVRSVVWVQGCTLGCPKCFNPHTHAQQPVKLLDPEELGAQLAQLPGTDGLTISGGEPFQQADACARLASTVQVTGLSVMVFSGYPFTFLSHSADAAVRRFLSSIDLLVAGPYIENRKSSRLWRGSSNQTLHYLTDRLRNSDSTTNDEAPQVEVASDGVMSSCTGFAAAEDMLLMERLLGTPVDPPEA